jgi:proline-specific peptidase
MLIASLIVCSCTANTTLPTPSAGVHSAYVVTPDGVRLFTRTIGTGHDTIVVLHVGPGVSMGYLVPDLEPLARRHVLIAYDQRGTGRSTLVTDSAALDAQRFGDDLESVRAYFKLEHVTLLAHSWGAAVAAVYATRYPERIARLIIVDGISVRRVFHARGIQAFDSRRDSASRQNLETLAAARMANPGDAAKCRAYYAVFFRATFVDASKLTTSRGDFCDGTSESLSNKVKSVDRFTLKSLGDWDWRPALHSVTAPTLVIRGTFDHVPIESSREWADAVQNGKLIELEGSGHFPYLEVPSRFFVTIERFLSGGLPGN